MHLLNMPHTEALVRHPWQRLLWFSYLRLSIPGEQDQNKACETPPSLSTPQKKAEVVSWHMFVLSLRPRVNIGAAYST